MLNLLRAELFRLMRRPAIYVSFALVVAYFALSAWLQARSAAPDAIASMQEELQAQNAQTEADQTDSDVIFTIDVWAADDLTARQTRTWHGLTNANVMGVVPGGLLGMLLCVIAAGVALDDFRGGMVKGRLAALTGTHVAAGRVPAGRTAYYAAKLLLVAGMDAVFLLVCMACALIATWASGFSVVDVEPAWQLALWALFSWLLLCGYTFFTMAVCWRIARNLSDHASGELFAVFIGSKTLEGALPPAATGIGAILPAVGCCLRAAFSWLPTNASAVLMEGASALFGGPFSSLSGTVIAHPFAHTAVIIAGFLAVSLALVFRGTRPRDVA